MSISSDDERVRKPNKTAALARQSIRPASSTRFVGDFATARRLLRSPGILQAGAGADIVDKTQPEEISLFYMDGELHRKRRATIAKYFTLKAIETRYEPIMTASAEMLVSRLEAAGGGRLDDAAFKFAVAVAAEIIGLDRSDLDGLAARIAATISTDPKKPVKNAEDEALKAFYETDVYPAIAARRADRREDVISRLLARQDGLADAASVDGRAWSLAMPLPPSRHPAPLVLGASGPAIACAIA